MLRRSDGASVVVLVIVALGSLIELFVPETAWVCRLAALGVIISLAALIYLGGPAASVTVGPSEVTVRNVFVRYRVPRASIAEITDKPAPALVLSTGERIPLSAFEPSWAARHGRYAMRLRDLRFALRRVPESPTTDESPMTDGTPTGQPVLRTTRRGHAAVAIGAALFFAVSGYFLLKHCA